MAERLLQSHLWNDEQVLWQGQPIADAPVAATAAREGFWRGLGTAIGLAVAGIVILMKLSPEFGTGFLKYGAIAVGREVVIAGVPEPARVVALLQTLQRPAAS